MLVSSQLPGRRMRCRITIRRRCAVSFVSQQVGAVFESNSLPRLHAHQRFSFLHSISCFESIVSKENKIFVAQNVLFLGSESTRFVQSRENCKFIVVARSAVTAERSTKFSRDESTLERTSRVSGIPFWSRKMETRISQFPLFHQGTFNAIFRSTHSPAQNASLLFAWSQLCWFVRGAKIPPPPSGFGVFFVFQILATMAESSVLRMRAGICDSRVCCSFGLVCCLDLVGSEHFFLFKISVACRGSRWQP